VYAELTLENITLTKGATPSNHIGGAGVYVNSGGTLIMQGSSTITNCKAGKGGGVHVSGGTFKMQDSAIVTPSTGSEQYTAGKNDVYLESGKTITVDDILSNNPVARITPQSYRETPVLTGNITGGSPQNRKKFTVPPQKIMENSENWNVFWYIATDGTLKAEVEDLETLKEAIDAAPADDKPFIIKLGDINGLTGVEIPGNKKITLKADNASKPAILKCPKKDQNEHKHLQVQRDATLILEGLITLQGADYGSNTQYALYVENRGTAEIKDGVTITGFKNGNIGPVVSDGELTMSGGEISGNKAKNGGGVYVGATGNFIMKGGTITKNKAKNGGGVYVNGDGPLNMQGSFTMTGGTIDGNIAGKGGGVYIKAAFRSFTMTGGTIKGNTATENGGGVCTQGNFEMRGGTITGNQSERNCKAVQLEHDFYWYGGDITDNGGADQGVNGKKAVADRNDSIYYFHNNTNPRKEPS